MYPPGNGELRGQDFSGELPGNFIHVSLLKMPKCQILRLFGMPPSLHHFVIDFRIVQMNKTIERKERREEACISVD